MYIIRRMALIATSTVAHLVGVLVYAGVELQLFMLLIEAAEPLSLVDCASLSILALLVSLMMISLVIHWWEHITQYET
jgi:hypothetical protein